MTTTEQGVLVDDKQKEEKSGGLMSQILAITRNIKLGTDITTISLGLPSVLELKESTLEILQKSALRHHDLLLAANSMEDPVSRLLLVVQYVFTFGATLNGRKPLNPVLGETSHCRSYPNTGEDDGAHDSVTACFGEQVSHHPPVSVYYAENKKHGVSVTGTTKVAANFLGTKVRVALDGTTRVELKKWGEVYTYSPPHALMHFFGFWSEYVGDVVISCNAHNYKAVFAFKQKGLWGEPHRIEGHITDGEKQIISFRGFWNKEVTFEDKRTKQTDVISSPLTTGDECELEYPKLEDEDEWSSRKIWQHVKSSTGARDAGRAKREVEEKQRRDRRLREERNEKWIPKYFYQIGENDWRIKENVTLWEIL
jgi:hypothetical protein